MDRRTGTPSSIRQRQWCQRNPERAAEVKRRYNAGRGKARRRDRHIEQTYGLTREAFMALLLGQGERCAICRTDKPNSHGWCVDHDHGSGAVRGILCHSCNVGIGALGDNATRVEAAARYLRQVDGS